PGSDEVSTIDEQTCAAPSTRCGVPEIRKDRNLACGTSVITKRRRKMSTSLPGSRMEVCRGAARARVESLLREHSHGTRRPRRAARDSRNVHGTVRRACAVALFGSAILVGAWTSRAAPSSAEQNWPQWRGPFQNGVAPQADPPTEWSETKNVKWKVKIPGEGAATPIVWNDHIFVQTAIATGKKVEEKNTDAGEQSPGRSGAPRAGSEQPEQFRGGPGAPGGPGRRGGRGGFGGGPKPSEVYQFVILCLNRQTGKLLWQQTAREEVPHEGHRPGDGSFAAPSPLTDGRHVFAYFGSRGMYCYDLTGKLEWSQDFG